MFDCFAFLLWDSFWCKNCRVNISVAVQYLLSGNNPPYYNKATTGEALSFKGHVLISLLMYYRCKDLHLND